MLNNTTRVNVIVFGHLLDITKSANIAIENVSDTNELVQQLELLYPFTNMRFAIAVDKKIVNENTPLNDNSVIALLPPFSGG
ncbi:MAG: thiamine protein [Segetibacter sp.]|nr:thiamine protein [Segetibacter sp.]